MPRRNAFTPVDALLAAFAGHTQFRPSQFDLRAALPAHDGGPRVELGLTYLERSARTFVSLPADAHARQRRRYGTAWRRAGYCWLPRSVGAAHVRWLGSERERDEELVVLAQANDVAALRALPARTPVGTPRQLARRCDLRRAIESARASVIPWNGAHLRYATSVRLPRALEVDVQVLAMQWPHERIKFHVYLVARSRRSPASALDGSSPIASTMRAHGYEVRMHDGRLYGSRITFSSAKAAAAEGTRMLTALR